MELQTLGWNVLTFGFIGTLVFALVEAWGLWKQNKEIWRQKSGQSLSVTWVMYGAFLLMAGALYGTSIGSIALMAAGTLIGLMHLPVLVGLYKFKGYTRWNHALLISLFVALWFMRESPHQDWFFLAFSFGSIASSVMQPYEIWRNKDAGVVAIQFVLAFLASTVFWVIYAFAIGDWVLMIISPAYLVILTATLCLWAKYRNSTRN